MPNGARIGNGVDGRIRVALGAVVGALAVGTLATGPAYGQIAGRAEERTPRAQERASEARRTPPLTLLEAVDRALDHDPALGTARAAAEAARVGQREAAAARWPELGVSGTLTRHEEPVVVGPIHGFDPEGAPAFDRTPVQAGAHLAWTALDGGGRAATVRRAGLNASAAEADLDARAQAVVTEVAAAYLQSESRARVLAAHDRRIAALAAERDRAARLREVGRAAEVEVLRVEAALAAAEADRAAVRSALGMARRELARLMGAPPEEPERRGLLRVRLAAPDDLPRRGELLARALEASPEIEAARRRRAGAEAGVSLARSARWPSLQAFGSWIDYTGLESEHQLEWAVGLRVDLPLFTGGRIERGVERARAELRAADERSRHAALQVERSVDRTVSALEETEARLRSLETAAARAREVARIEALRMETGTGTQTDYLDAEAASLAADAALAEARHARVLARVELARALGILDRAWLRANLEVGR